MDLIKRHVNEMILLDAKQNKKKNAIYALSLFFMVFKTNVDYQIILLFVIENETYKAISEVVAVIQNLI